jgi:hypothetical protein
MAMAISDDLFLAILAMDAYNRGYDPGLNVSGNSIGYAILRNDPLPADFQAKSFFAQAYNWLGQTVISYRGTDNRNWAASVGGLFHGGRTRDVVVWPKADTR